MGDRLRAGIPSRYVTSQLGQLSLASLWGRLIEYQIRLGKGGNVTSAGWQVTLCDPMWHVSTRSSVATLRTAIHLLLTYLLALVGQDVHDLFCLVVRRTAGHSDTYSCYGPSSIIKYQGSYSSQGSAAAETASLATPSSTMAGSQSCWSRPVGYARQVVAASLQYT